MLNKRHKPDEIVSKLRQVDVLRGPGLTMADAIRQIGVTQLRYYRWRKTYGGMVSTEDQELAIQKAALERDGYSIVFEEKKSGTKRNDRAQLELALKILTKGDKLVVLRLDSLGLSLHDLANIAHEIDADGAHLRVIEQSVDTATSAGRAVFGMLAVFTQFETDVRRERQAEGISRAKKRGVYTGGKPRINRDEVGKLSIDGVRPSAIAKTLGVSCMSVYRILRELEASD